MSTPIRSEDGLDNPLLYAPRWARQSPRVEPEMSAFADAPPTAPEHVSAPKSAIADLDSDDVPISGKPEKCAAAGPAPAAPHRLADAPPMAPTISDSSPMAPGIGGPNVELPTPRLRPFEGDIAVQELRRRLSLEPDTVPTPPIRGQREPRSGANLTPWIGRFSFVLVLAAIVALGVTLLAIPQEALQQADVTAGVVTPLPDDLSQTSIAPARLIVESQKAFANEPLPLGISLDAASGEETVTLVGLTKGTQLSAGTPVGLTGWQVSARDLGTAFAHPPKDFVGVMEAAIDLRSPRDRLMDSQMVRLEWVPKTEARLAPPLESPKTPPAVQLLDPEEIAMLIKRGEDFLRNGDFASARLATFRRKIRRL